MRMDASDPEPAAVALVVRRNELYHGVVSNPDVDAYHRARGDSLATTLRALAAIAEGE